MIGRPVGTIVAARGGLLEARVPRLCIGAGVRIFTRSGKCVAASVAAATERTVTLAPHGALDGVAIGDRVEADQSALDVCLGTAVLGRAIDASGRPLDDGPEFMVSSRASGASRYQPNDRCPIATRFVTGVRAIDGPLAFGIGARIGIFGAPGCGKSTLLEAIVAGSGADVIVIGLVGERGREAERWLARIDRQTSIVCATGDRSAAERLRAAHVAFAQADALRRRGLHVLLVLDSLARVAAAARDLAVGAGEPVGRGGYPPSVFATLASLIEQAGNFGTGSITLIATVLADGADEHDPVSDACRSLLDGHIALAERLAREGWFPAIDLPASASRTIADIAASDHLVGARAVRRAVAALDETREARSFGLDPGAADPAVRRAVAAQSALRAFLCQSGPCDPSATLTELRRLTDMLTDGYLC